MPGGLGRGWHWCASGIVDSVREGSRPSTSNKAPYLVPMGDSQGDLVVGEGRPAPAPSPLARSMCE